MSPWECRPWRGFPSQSGKYLDWTLNDEWGSFTWRWSRVGGNSMGRSLEMGRAG